MGIINERSSLEVVDTVTASSFCRRRLPVVLKKLEMAENLKAAVEFIEAGHIRLVMVGNYTKTFPLNYAYRIVNREGDRTYLL